MTVTETTPLALHTETVIPDWVDYNGHMNVAYYVLIFDHATDALQDYLNIGTDYREQTGGSVFVVESHLTYDQEVMEGINVSVTTQIIGSDPKRLHIFHRMTETGSDETVATNELMILHVDLNTRRVAPFPEEVQAEITELAERHKILGKPKQSGNTIEIPQKK
jgi:acyl-CoA thioester hydrolase